MKALFFGKNCFSVLGQDDWLCAKQNWGVVIGMIELTKKIDFLGVYGLRLRKTEQTGLWASLFEQNNFTFIYLRILVIWKTWLAAKINWKTMCPQDSVFKVVSIRNTIFLKFVKLYWQSFKFKVSTFIFSVNFIFCLTIIDVVDLVLKEFNYSLVYRMYD